MSSSCLLTWVLRLRLGPCDLLCRKIARRRPLLRLVCLVNIARTRSKAQCRSALTPKTIETRNITERKATGSSSVCQCLRPFLVSLLLHLDIEIPSQELARARKKKRTKAPVSFFFYNGWMVLDVISPSQERSLAPSSSVTITATMLVSCLWFSLSKACANGRRSRRNFGKWHTPDPRAGDQRVQILVNNLEFVPSTAGRSRVGIL